MLLVNFRKKRSIIKHGFCRRQKHEMRERGHAFDMEEKIEKEDKRIYTLAREKPTLAVLKMGVPVAVGMLFMVAYNLVDTYFIGMLNDDYQLAAANLAYPVLMVMIAVAGIVGNGGASYIARCMGAGSMERAEKTLMHGFEMILFFGVLLALAGSIWLHPIVTLLGARDTTYAYTCQYTYVLFLGAFFAMGNYAFGQLLRSEGSALYSMVGMIAGTVANILLDPIFIFGLHLEIRGAAIATVLGNVLSVVYFLWVYVTGRSVLKLHASDIGCDGSIIKEIMLVGVPHTLEQFLSTAAILVLNNLAAAYGGLTVAAMGVSSKIMSFGNYIYQGLTAGCQPLIGYNYGAGNLPRLEKIIKAGVSIVTGIELCIMALFALLAPQMIGLFSETEEVISIGTMTLRASILILPFVGTTAMVRNVYNAMGKPLYAFSITIVRQLVLYIPFLIVFDRVWGYVGLIHAQPAEELVCALFALVLLRRTLKKLQKIIQNESVQSMH